MTEKSYPAALTDVVRQRIAQAGGTIASSMAHIANGNPLAAETDPERRIDRLQTKTGLSRQEARYVAMGIDAAAAAEAPEDGRETLQAQKEGGPEKLIGPTFDFVGVAFLDLGRRVADAVARVAFRNRRGGLGSGFLVAPGLFLTNHHVIGSPEAAAELCLEFDYEADSRNATLIVSRFALDPRVFLTDTIEGLDYTLVGVGEQLDGPRSLDEFGYVPLSDASDKHMLGEVANIIQHPAGRFKEVVLRENRLVSRDETNEVLHYIADTEPGSSGSPVCNNDWEPIALHHWGGPFVEEVGRNGRMLPREINEGVRISAIVRDAKTRAPVQDRVTSAALDKAIRLWDAPRRAGESAGAAVSGREEVPPEPKRTDAASAQIAAGPRTNADGSITWTFPIEISVRAPLFDRPAAGPEPRVAEPIDQTPRPRAGSEAGARTKEDFSDRAGYEPGFISGFVVPMPDTSKVPFRLAEVLGAAEGDDPNELRYHHFSILMNADRRLALVTACNIDGARAKAVNREDKTVKDAPTLADLGVESLGAAGRDAGAEGAEASDDFRPDRRIRPEEQMNRPFYEKQIVAGFPKATAPGRIARMFQKGHIIMRGDPAWGVEEEAVAAERDTFFYTNAAPQLGFFNQGSALNRPGSKGKLRWRAVETYVLRNAVTDRRRISVFAGPIFAETDPVYRFEAKVPMRFWKIAVWASEGDLQAVALVADQRPLIETMPEAMLLDPDRGAEAFGDPDELARVSEFLSTVAEIEALTGLDFGDALRRADIRSGGKTGVPAIDEGLEGAKKRAARKRRKPG
ncbi:MAG: DNA/RNA non-specific endonuclease [Rhizobiaceae bacterium]|nr:DNA/RNA non-specific endonuclease [Rhizobiaceae bacterium]